MKPNYSTSMRHLRTLFLIVLGTLACTLAYAQGLNVSGTVTSATDGEPITGASVVEKGTSRGTITNIDGNFKLEVNSGATLVISYLGFKTVEVKATPSMNIVLEENAASLNEVVVTGYTTQRKADLTGAVSVMNMKDPVSESNPNMLGSMQGKLAGVQIVTDAAPGSGGSTVRVRGMSTINASDPLYIIDGIPSSENLNSLNAADIESIQVLKDAASASIYGSRAANGVIIITTKQGKGNRLAVNVNYALSLQTVGKTYDMLNAQQWGEVFWAANNNAGLRPSHPFYGNGSTPVLAEYLDASRNVKSADTDWQDEVYSSAWTHNLSANVTNSGEKGSMMFSANYINQDGLMDYTFYRRYSARVNSTYKLSKYFSVGENLMIAKWFDRGYSTGDDRGIPYTAMRQHPAIPVRDALGKFTNPMQLASSDISNPMHVLYNGRDNSNESWRIFGNGYLEVFPIKGLTLKTNFGIEHVQFFNKTLTRRILASDVNSMNRAYGQGDTWTWTNTAAYNVNLGQHHLNLLAGTEAIKYVFEDLSGFRNKYAFEDANYMQLNAGEGTQTNGGGKAEWALFSYFGKADYNYADRYLLSATLRRDATSRLYRGQNSGVFPAFSAAWRITEEKFFKRNNILNDAKLRVAWGQNGNSAISNNYAAYSTYAYNLGNGSYDLDGTGNAIVGGITIAASGNKNLKWETTTQTNLGLDLNMLNNALSLSFDYYWKKTKDMLTVPPTLAVAGENAAMWMNTGDMDNRGWELTVAYNSPQYNDFSWNGSLNLSSYKNKVVKLNNFVSTIGEDYRLMAGQPMGVYYGYMADGIFQTQEEVDAHGVQPGKGVGRIRYKDLDGNNEINEKDRTIIGDPNPDIAMGLNLSATWKGLTLSAFFTGEFGFDIYNTTKRQLDFMSYGDKSSNRGANILNAWTPQNRGASIPQVSVVDNNNEMRMSTYFVEDGSYFKLKYLKLQYQLPKTLLKKFAVADINLYGQLENVFAITGYSGLDPELPIGGYGARIDNGPYPRGRTFTFGVNLQF